LVNLVISAFPAFIIALRTTSYLPTSRLHPLQLMMSSSFGGLFGKMKSALPQEAHLNEIWSVIAFNSLRQNETEEEARQVGRASVMEPLCKSSLWATNT
jgi:hypothetical protein